MLTDSDDSGIDDDNPFLKCRSINKFYWERKDLVNTLPEHYSVRINFKKKRKKAVDAMDKKIPTQGISGLGSKVKYNRLNLLDVMIVDPTV